MDHREPRPHPDPWVDLIRTYITQSVSALTGQGLAVDRSWLDPRDPRDATIVLADARALVWDETTGWRLGRFLSGEQGSRTELGGVTYLGGGPLLHPRDLAARITVGASSSRREYRSYADARDGLDDALRAL